MSKCFCGCGRKVKIIHLGLNKQGARTVALVEKLEVARGRAEADGPIQEGGDVQPTLDGIDGLIREGRRFEEFWSAAIHDGYTPASREETMRVKREWHAWGQLGVSTVALFELPPDQRLAAVRPG